MKDAMIAKIGSIRSASFGDPPKQFLWDRDLGLKYKKEKPLNLDVNRIRAV